MKESEGERERAVWVGIHRQGERSGVSLEPLFASSSLT